MKKAFVIMAGLLAVCALQAEEKKFKIIYDETESVRGELYQYSERYLGTRDVVTENGTTYQLQKIALSVPNPNKNNTTNTKKTEQPKEKTVIKQQLPLSEETLMATNMAKKAESVAKQIYQIRETRMNILSGDVEHAPADGKAMELVLNELKRQEKALTGMFVGKTITRSKQSIQFVKVGDFATAEEHVICRFDPKQGVLEANSEAGEPVILKISRAFRPVTDGKKYKKGQEPQELYRSTYRVYYNNQLMYEKTFTL